MITEEIKSIAESIEDDLVKIRRHIHENPEVGYKEYETADYICEILDQAGIHYKRNIAITGILAEIKGEKDGPTVLLRADMDALNMEEMRSWEHTSKNKGVMHACGHDGHIAWGIGAMLILKKMENKIKGTVKCIFQPAEEGGGGAKKAIEEGILENPKVDAVFGAHVWPPLDTGVIGVKYDGIMAAPAFFSIKVKGKGGHSASPHETIDPISIGAQIYMGLQTIISRSTTPTEPVVLSVTQFHSGTAHNVIPDDAVLAGSVRTVTKTMSSFMATKMEEVARGIAKANGGDIDFSFQTYYPPVINDTEMVHHLKKSASKIVGEEKIKVLQQPSMAGEDFAYYLQKVPGTFFFVGTKNEEAGIDKPLHNPYFTLDEKVLKIAAAVMAQATLDYMNGED